MNQIEVQIVYLKILQAVFACFHHMPMVWVPELSSSTTIQISHHMYKTKDNLKFYFSLPVEQIVWQDIEGL